MKTWEKNIRRVEPYVPGEQPKVKDVVKLNTNENPYPPTPKVHEAAERMNISDLRLYPDPEVTDLVHAIAAYYGMNDNQVFVGVGSDDVLSMCFLTFFNSDKPILFPNISYSFYSVWADLYRIPYEKQPLDKDFNIIPEDYYKENGGVVFPNPNAPTALYMELDKVEDIIKLDDGNHVFIFCIQCNGIRFRSFSLDHFGENDSGRFFSFSDASAAIVDLFHRQPVRRMVIGTGKKKVVDPAVRAFGKHILMRKPSGPPRLSPGNRSLFQHGDDAVGNLLISVAISHDMQFLL